MISNHSYQSREEVHYFCSMSSNEILEVALLKVLSIVYFAFHIPLIWFANVFFKLFTLIS